MTGRTPLAPYAVSAANARGRLHPEPEAPPRSPWQRDRDRIIHSSAFRKLQYKTQVFVNHEGDFFRTRLTHSIEVAQIARSIARELGLDEDLTEALALAHDLGHPPFGHAGEEALNLAMKPFGGFDHNAQSLRVVTLLESRYAGWDGLNLTWETLEGLTKHNGPLRNPPPYIADYNDRHKLDLGTHASAEAQVAALADDIAYHSHDLDDGLRARLFTPDDMAHLPVVGEARALEMVMTGRTVDADEALRIGLVSRLVDNANEGDAVAAGMAFAREFSGYSLPVLSFARDAVKRAGETPLHEGLKIETDLGTLAFQTQDSVEGMAAFAEKRKPVFKDK